MLELIDAGNIYLNQQLIRKEMKNVHEVREKIGMVFQNYELFPHKKTIENLILAPLNVYNRERIEVVKEAEELLMRVGLLEKKMLIQDCYQGDKSKE